MKISAEQDIGQQRFKRDCQRESIRSNEKFEKLKKGQLARSKINKTAVEHQQGIEYHQILKQIEVD